MSKVLKRKFTEEEINSIIYEDGLDDEDQNPIFETVHQEMIYADTEKSSTTWEIVIKDLNTGVFYKAELGKSPWIGQDKANTEKKWTEVKPKKRTITVYE